MIQLPLVVPHNQENNKNVVEYGYHLFQKKTIIHGLKIYPVLERIFSGQ